MSPRDAAPAPYVTALSNRIRGLWPLRHSHPRFREWIYDDIRRLRGLR